MKIALLALLGLALGTLGGAALGIGAGLAWVEIFKTTSFEGHSGVLVFSTFMPAGAAIGGIGRALLFPSATPIRHRTRAGRAPGTLNQAVIAAFVQCKMAGCVSAELHYFWSQQ